MNFKVRDFLIEIARTKSIMITYSELVNKCNLKINLNSENGRRYLGEILGEICEYEHSFNRPMISSLVFYKNENDHGNGFYSLAESLGKGDAKKLKKDLYGFAEAENCRKYWQDNENYKRFAKIEKINNPLANLFKLFIDYSQHENIKIWKNEYYDFVEDVNKLRISLTDNPNVSIEHQLHYQNLKNASIRSYSEFIRKWLKEKANGIASRGQSILSGADFEKIINDENFKKIARKVLEKPILENYNEFMIWWQNNKLINFRPLLINRALAACNPQILSSIAYSKKFWEAIDFLNKNYNFNIENENQSNWFQGNHSVTTWLDNNLEEDLNKYSINPLEKIIARNIFAWMLVEEGFISKNLKFNSLILTEKPKNIFSDNKEIPSEFKEVEVDYESEYRYKKDLGNAGEELVKNYEIQKLKNNNLHHLAEKVKIVKDGLGYDIYSFDSLGREKFIEVKTTEGDIKSSFYLSKTEFKFMRLNIGKYVIYRIYDFNSILKSGKYFEISENVENQLNLKPILFEVNIK